MRQSMRKLAWGALGLAAGLAPPAAQAQITDDGLLHRAIGAPDDWHLSGSVRARFEAIDGQFREEAVNRDQVLALRTTAFAEYDSGPVRVGAEFHDARAYFQRRGSSVGTDVVNALEFSQYYVQGDLGDALGTGTTSYLKAGRMTMQLGSERLVARQGFRTSVTSFTGVRLTREGENDREFVAFWTMPTVRLPTGTIAIRRNRPQWDRENTDLQLFGVFNRVPVGGDTRLETYAYGLIERGESQEDRSDRRLFTPGVRLFAKPDSGIVFEVEGMAQFGRGRDGSPDSGKPVVPVEAYGFHGDIGYRFAGGWKPELTAFFDYYTGNRREGRIGRFDTLYGARRFEFGPTELFGAADRSNMLSPGARMKASPADGLSVMGDYRLLRLASAIDRFSNSDVRDATGRAGRNAGQQIQLQVEYDLIKDILALDLGYARLFKGRFLRDAPNAPDPRDVSYGYASIMFSF
ncbi:alginate export family protein [Sphingomonas sp. NBWT7]|nr:alginate export family protein [Sphingomonas sp. NBWT7]